MSIPSSFNPLGSRGTREDPEYLVLEDYSTGALLSLPTPYMLRYSLLYTCDFPINGTILATHVILKKVIAATPGKYIGWHPEGEEGVLYNREDMLWLAEDPVPQLGELTDVVCTLYGGTMQPVAVGPGFSTLEVLFPNPKTTDPGKLAEFTMEEVNGVQKFTFYLSIAQINATAKLLNPIISGNLVKITTSPDGEQHAIIKATRYPSLNCAYGTRYIFRKS